MDFLPSLNVSLAGSVAGMQAAFTCAVVVVVMCIELPRRWSSATSDAGGQIVQVNQRSDLKTSVKAGVQIVVRHAPEVAGLVAVLTIAVALRVQNNVAPMNPELIPAWEQIKREWPLLQGADTLISFQQMLKLTIFASSVRHSGQTSLGGMAAVFALAAGTARAALATQSSAYWLDGPLGAQTAVIAEVAAVPLLAKLAFDKLRTSPVTAAAAISLVTWYASHHYLSLATHGGEDVSIDKLFTLTHALELFSALAFMANTFVAENQAKAGFVHLLMPVQSGLAAYYFLTAFVNGYPGQWVAAGRPWCLLIIGALAQFGAYLATSAFYIASYFGNGDAPSTTAGESQGAANGRAAKEEADMKAANEAFDLARRALPMERAGAAARGMQAMW